MRATQRDWDLRAAHLAALGDEEALRTLLDRIRGGVPTESDVVEAGRALYHPEDPVTHAQSLAMVADVLSGLVSGDYASVGFLCLLPDGLELYAADVNEVRTTRMLGRVRHWRWTDLAPELPQDLGRRRFALAGGIGRGDTTGPAADPVTVAHMIVESLPDMPLDEPFKIVVVNGCPEWSVISTVAAAAQDSYHGAGTLLHLVVDTAQPLVKSLVRQAPIGQRHDLVLLRHDDAGGVKLHPHPIFQTGEKGSEQHHLDVYVPIGPPGPVLLPVMVCSPRNAPSQWQPVEMVRLPLVRGRRSRITVMLDGDARITLSGSTEAGLPETDPRAWTDLISAVPRQLSGQPVDIVFAVELVQTTALIRGWELVQAAIDAMCAEAWTPDLIHVGVIGYGQHFGNFPRNVTLTAPLDTPDRVRDQIAAWPLMGNEQDYAAAIEDALTIGAAQPWRQDVARYFVTVGGRPPHPPSKEVDPARGCPLQLDWRDGVRRLDELAVHRISLWCDPETQEPLYADIPLRERRIQAWRALGAHGHLVALETSVEELLRAVNVNYLPTSVPFAYAVPTLASAGQSLRRSA